MFNLTFIYSNGTTWFAGGFNTMEDLNRWLDNEKTKPYWDNTTTTQIDEIVPPVQE